jgi:hypothetical protein
LRRLWIILAAAVVLAAPLEAGIEYKARTWQEGDQATEQAEISVWAKIDGDNARVEFQESGNPLMTQGTYLLTTDAGQTLYLVNPEEKTYSTFDLDQVFQMLGSLEESGMVSFEVENPQVETLESGEGKVVAGLSTQHARYRTSYDMKMKILGLKRSQRIETVKEIWYTTAVSDAGMGVWLRREPPSTGTDLDVLIGLEMEKLEGGFPLETTETSVMTGKKGRQTTTVTRMRVEELQQGASFPAGTWEIPSDYTPVEMMPVGALAAGSEEQGEQEEKGGVLGRFKKFGKKKE